MNKSHPFRTFLSCVVAAAALACRATDTKPHHDTPAPAANAAAQSAKDPKAAPAAQPAAQANSAASAVDDEFRKLLAGMGVHYFPAEKKLEIAGWVNMQTGMVEVFACAPKGKTHESVIVLDCVPSGLHAGLLALGLEPGSPAEMGPGAQFKPPTGDPVLIELRWNDAAGVEHTARAEDWLWDKKLEAVMPRQPWIFAGSFMQPVQGGADTATFAADFVKSMVTTYHDASSILENPQTDGDDDELYCSNDKAVPPVGTKLTAIFRSGK